MSKHTPGPWTAYESLGCMMIANDKGEFIEYPLNGRPQGMIDGNRIVSCVNACENLADPSVVPELIEALRDVYNYFWNPDVSRPILSEGDVCDAVESALKKAGVK